MSWAFHPENLSKNVLELLGRLELVLVKFDVLFPLQAAVDLAIISSLAFF